MDIWFGDDDEEPAVDLKDESPSGTGPRTGPEPGPNGAPTDAASPPSLTMMAEPEERIIGPPGYRMDKSDFLLGMHKRIPIHLDQLDKDVIIRPLTDGELSEIFSMLSSKLSSTPSSPQFNSIDISTNLRLLRRICSLALTQPELTEDEIGHLPFGIPGFLAKRVLEISGLYEKAGDDAIYFSKTPEGRELAAIAIDHGYRLALHPKDLTRPQINFLIAVTNTRAQTAHLMESLGGDEDGGTMILFPD